MSTTIKSNNAETMIKSDIPGLEERLARYAIEVIAGRNPTAAAAEWNLPEFIRRSTLHKSQIGLLLQLVEKGRLTWKELLKAADKSSGRELAGCRGSMSKNARASKLPSDWSKYSLDQKSNEYVLEIRSDVREALKATLQRP